MLAVTQNVAGGVMVKAAVPNPGAGAFQMLLTYSISDEYEERIPFVNDASSMGTTG